MTLPEAIEIYKTYRAYAFLAGVNNVVCLYKEHKWKFDDRVADYVIYGGHQDRVVKGKYFKYKRDTLEPAEKALLSPPNIIRPYRNFEKLYEEVSNRLNPIAYIDVLTYYDVALRIGFLLEKPIFPKKMVYVYAGAWKGLDALQKDKVKHLSHSFPKENVYDISLFKSDFKKLDSMYIEDFLCVFHKELDHLSSCTKEELLRSMKFHGTHKKIKDCYLYNYDIY